MYHHVAKYIHGDQDPDKMLTPKGFMRIKPKQTVSPTKPIMSPSNPSKWQVTPARLINKP